jgi:hypothetical protein
MSKMVMPEQKILELLSDRLWRIEGAKLYKIKDKEANVAFYQPNQAQRDLHRKQWYRNVIVKARQL